ncbi:extracellular solute-binding protein [Candidatus Aerophobetes bacterium]|nr:extracellular solute-binding protein [Candidatus Aerophobetes bacterium]
MSAKKSLILFLTVLFSVLLVSGYLFAESPALEGKGLAPITDRPVYFRGWMYRTHIVLDNVDRYNRELNANVDYATITGDYPSIMETQFIAKAPLDILYANPSQACRYYDAGWILPVDSLPHVEKIKADMYPHIRDAWTYKGKLLGLSYFVTTRGVMHVNLKKLAEVGLTEADLPATWDALYDQLYKIRERGIRYPFLPHWFNEWYGISWAFNFEVLNRGGQVAHSETHKPLVTVDGPAGDTLRAWKRIWNDGLVPREVLTYLEPDHLEAWGSGEYVYSPQQMYDLKRFNEPRYSLFAGYCSLVPYKGQSWGFIDSAMYLISNRARTQDHTRDVMAFYSWYGYRDHEGKLFVGQRWMEDSMLFSAYREVMESPGTKAMMTEFFARPQDYDTALKVYEHSPYAKGVFNVVWAEEFNAWLKETMQRFLLEDRPVDATINAIRDKINELNALYGIG